MQFCQIVKQYAQLYETAFGSQESLPSTLANEYNMDHHLLETYLESFSLKSQEVSTSLSAEPEETKTVMIDTRP